jgi:hypothetical protein
MNEATFAAHCLRPVLQARTRAADASDRERLLHESGVLVLEMDFSGC